MTRIGKGALCAALSLVLFSGSAGTAQWTVTTTVETTEYATNDAVSHGFYDDVSDQAYDGGGQGYGGGQRGGSAVLAQYGPFSVVSDDVVEMNGDTDSYTPQEFRALLAEHPGIRTLRLVECGGTVDDTANLELARVIRNAGIATHVPSFGSVRSGGVELFLAGVRRSAEPGAEFLVHSWLDDYGREASEVPMSDPVHADYIDYYEDMGLSPQNACGFYALTNSVPHSSARQVTLQELARYNVLN